MAAMTTSSFTSSAVTTLDGWRAFVEHDREPMDPLDASELGRLTPAETRRLPPSRLRCPGGQCTPSARPSQPCSQVPSGPNSPSLRQTGGTGSSTTTCWPFSPSTTTRRGARPQFGNSGPFRRHPRAGRLGPPAQRPRVGLADPIDRDSAQDPVHRHHRWTRRCASHEAFGLTAQPGERHLASWARVTLLSENSSSSVTG
jgi:hypothetical protein